MHPPSPILRCLAAALAGFTFVAALAAAPGVRVENVRRAFHDGGHNAFTDLIRWRGRLWLAFRSSPDGHAVNPKSSVIVLSSPDGKEWEEVHRFSVPQRDVRDPHFLDFAGKLFVYTGTWWTGEAALPRERHDMNQHLGYAAHTGDGKAWSEPVLLEGTYGHYIWRAAAHGGKAYLCGRRKRGFSEKEDGGGASPLVESAMLESDDGLRWRFHSLFQEERGNETAFLFEEDGALVAVSRRDQDGSQLARSAPPWTEMRRSDLPVFIGGPLLARWGDRLLVGGRRQLPDGPRTALSWLDGGELSQFALLPSAGDNSYPGFVDLGGGRGLVSWYSSHEKDGDGKTITAIYLADLVLAEP